MDYNYNSLVKEVEETNSLILEQNEQLDLFYSDFKIINTSITFILLIFLCIWLFNAPMRTLER